MIRPNMGELTRTQQVISAFGGICRTEEIQPNQFADMQGLTADHYPAMAVRGERGEVAQAENLGQRMTGETGVYDVDKPLALVGRDELWQLLACQKGTDSETDDQTVEMRLMRGEWWWRKGKQSSDNKTGEVPLLTMPVGARPVMVSMGAQVVVFPSKVAFNTSDGTLTRLENTTTVYPTKEKYGYCRLSDAGAVDINYTTGATAPSDPQGGAYWMDTTSMTLKQYDATDKKWVAVTTTYVKIAQQGIGKGFAVYDGVTITGAKYGLDGDTVLWDVADDYIVITGLLGSEGSASGAVTVKRVVPDMDFVVEMGNRLWGCSSAKHEIYCSKLGDPTNWNCFMGVAGDSYAATVGTAGDFTGASAYGSSVLFFKEGLIHKVYGSKPSNFQISTVHAPGVQKGSDQSLALVEEVLYYKGVGGVYAYDGNMPQRISEDLGSGMYQGAVGGRWDHRYVISMQELYGWWHMFVFDPRRGCWHRQDDTQMICCADVGEELYYYRQNADGKYRLISMGDSTGYAPRGSASGNYRAEHQVSGPVAWYAETGDIDATTMDNLTVSQIRLRMEIAARSRVRVLLRYDDEMAWQEVWGSAGASRRAMTLPLVPRRCGKMRLRLEGTGDCRLYAMILIMEQGSELRGSL
nr:MAG TPA: stabilization protein [Caudoviricetes sp.]